MLVPRLTTARPAAPYASRRRSSFDGSSLVGATGTAGATTTGGGAGGGTAAAGGATGAGAGAISSGLSGGTVMRSIPGSALVVRRYDHGALPGAVARSSCSP